MTELRESKNTPESVVEVGNPTLPTETVIIEPPRMLDAVRDEDGNKHFCYGTSHRSIWFSARDLVVDEKATFARLLPVHTMLTSRVKSDFKELVESHVSFREGRVASAPGWTGGHYVLGNGDVISPDNPVDEPIVAFDRENKFGRRGNSKTWIRGIAGIVKGQPLILPCLSMAFVGPLMRFAPPHYITPMIELVGNRETGKTTLALLAASVWAGRQDSGTGGGETWKTTLNALGPTSSRHRDNLLVLDETNLSSTRGKRAGQNLSDAVMNLVTPLPKARMGDGINVPTVKLAILSTSNVRLSDMFPGDAAVRDAVESRSMTVYVPKMGVLASLPPNFDSTRDAMRELHRISASSFGSIGRRFLRYLVREVAKDEARFRRRIAKFLESFEAKLQAEGRLNSDRHMKTFSLLGLGAHLAAEAGCMPERWGAEAAVSALYQEHLARETGKKLVDAVASIETYSRNASLVLKGDKAHASAKCDVNKVDGFLLKAAGYRSILIGTARFREAFPHHRAVLNELKAKGLLKMEEGLKPKLSIKAPTWCASKGRVYQINLPLVIKAKPKAKA